MENSYKWIPFFLTSLGPHPQHSIALGLNAGVLFICLIFSSFIHPSIQYIDLFNSYYTNGIESILRNTQFILGLLRDDVYPFGVLSTSNCESNSKFVDWKECKWPADGIPLSQHPVVFGLDCGKRFFFSFFYCLMYYAKNCEFVPSIKPSLTYLPKWPSWGQLSQLIRVSTFIQGAARWPTLL